MSIVLALAKGTGCDVGHNSRPECVLDWADWRFLHELKQELKA